MSCVPGHTSQEMNESSHYDAGLNLAAKHIYATKCYAEYLKLSKQKEDLTVFDFFNQQLRDPFSCEPIFENVCALADFFRNSSSFILVSQETEGVNVLPDGCWIVRLFRTAVAPLRDSVVEPISIQKAAKYEVPFMKHLKPEAPSTQVDTLSIPLASKPDVSRESETQLVRVDVPLKQSGTDLVLRRISLLCGAEIWTPQNRTGKRLYSKDLINAIEQLPASQKPPNLSERLPECLLDRKVGTWIRKVLRSPHIMVPFLTKLLNEQNPIVLELVFERFDDLFPESERLKMYPDCTRLFRMFLKIHMSGCEIVSLNRKWMLRMNKAANIGGWKIPENKPEFKNLPVNFNRDVVKPTGGTDTETVPDDEFVMPMQLFENVPEIQAVHAVEPVETNDCEKRLEKCLKSFCDLLISDLGFHILMVKKYPGIIDAVVKLRKFDD